MTRTRWAPATVAQINAIMRMASELRREAVAQLNRRDASKVISALGAGDSIEQYRLSGK